MPVKVQDSEAKGDEFNGSRREIITRRILGILPLLPDFAWQRYPNTRPLAIACDARTDIHPQYDASETVQLWRIKQEDIRAKAGVIWPEGFPVHLSLLTFRPNLLLNTSTIGNEGRCRADA